MTTEISTVTIHMAASLDGFIAKKDGSVAWMQTTDSYDNGFAGPNAEEVDAFLKTIDCYVMGSATYGLAVKLGWPYRDTPVFVLTNRKLSTDKASVEFCAGDLSTLVNDKLKPKFKNIWMVGGAMLTKEFIHLGLADEIRMMVLPIILGDGVLFFDYVGRELPLHLKAVTAYKSGLVELWYEIRKQ